MQPAETDRRAWGLGVASHRLGAWASGARPSSNTVSIAHARPQRSEDVYEHPVREICCLPLGPGASRREGVPGALRLRAGRVPAARLCRPRGRSPGAGRGADRLREDAGRRVRRTPGPAARAEVLLHHPDQGAEQPEVRRPGQPLRQRQGRPAHRRQLDQLRGPDRRDDDRGPAEHAVRRVQHPARSLVRRDGRSALPGRPRPWRGVGRGADPPAGLGLGGVVVRDREQRRGVRRLARDRPRQHGRRPGGEAAGAAVPARDGGQAAARPVRR